MRTPISHCLWLIAALSGLSVATGVGQRRETPPSAGRMEKPTKEDAGASEYVGSLACAECHRSIYRSYVRTDMGRSMRRPDAPFLMGVPASASIFDAKLNRHFEVHAREGYLYQDEYELNQGHEVFREVQRVEWIIGAGANGLGALVRRGDYLFEAPLSYYTNAREWKLSPGYQYGDYGFSRPVLPGCIFCHSGRPLPVPEGGGRFEEPAFAELAIGCENCHGPGGAHAIEKQANLPPSGSSSIVNPGRLTPWLADNICMMCHQTGQARVLQPGKQYSDFRPGEDLDKTLSIFQIPFERSKPPQDDLLEHYLSMRLSKCYRLSGSKLSCMTCHDPHVQPGKEEAPGYFRKKCLGCHRTDSCTASDALRQATHPQDNCISCHMPKRDLTVISHSALTNHRIVATANEAFPPEAFQMTSPGLPDLVDLSAAPGAKGGPTPLVLLQAYRQVMLVDPAYRQRYWELGAELARDHPDDLGVLQALTDLSLQRKDREGMEGAIGYLEKAEHDRGAQMADFMLLAQLYAASGRLADAVQTLRRGIAQFPYEPDLYRLLGKAYLSTGQKAESCAIFSKANSLFPQYDDIRSQARGCDSRAGP